MFNFKTKLAILFILFSIFLTSCSNQSNTIDIYNPDFEIGIIETSKDIDESYITFYNEEINPIGTHQLNFGHMGSPLNVPIIYDSKMYVLPFRNSQDEMSMVLEYDLKNGHYETYDIGQPIMDSSCIDSKFVYAINNFSNHSQIYKYVRSKDNFYSLSIDGAKIEHLTIYDDMLYAFGSIESKDQINSFLYLIDAETFKLTDTIDITAYGYNHEDSFKLDDNLYFTSSYEVYGSNKYPSNILSKYNINNKTLSEINLQSNYPFQIFPYKDQLIISHFNPLTFKGNTITIYNPKTKKQQLKTLKNDLNQIYIKENKLYSIDDHYLYRYEIDNDMNFELLNKIDIYTRKNHDSNYYISGFFIKDSNYRKIPQMPN